MINITMQDHKWIKELLERFDFVLWDRCTYDSARYVFNVYGWIYRRNDSYKDFMTLKLWLKTRKVGYVSSSIEYHHRIAEILVTGRPKCQRVEHLFEIKNCVRLTQKT